MALEIQIERHERRHQRLDVIVGGLPGSWP
jgi:hypothetical protein